MCDPSQFGLYEWDASMPPGERKARPSTKLLRRLFKVDDVPQNAAVMHLKPALTQCHLALRS